jgi:signal transduction histidine kinase
MRPLPHPADPSPWELAAETIALKVRWFGLLVGYALVNVEQRPKADVTALNVILGLGVLYTLTDAWHSLRGRIFLARYPLVTSLLEAVFIGLLCRYDVGLESPFRYYYVLSLIVCAMRHKPEVTAATCALHCGSYVLLYMTLPEDERAGRSVVVMAVLLWWVTWAGNALAALLKQIGNHLFALNRALTDQQQQLEDRIAERTRQLQEAQAHLLHQEKMAAFGLLAAGIAHEVGNPLTSISSLVQMVQKRSGDAYTQEKLGLVGGQLQRIQSTLRELINFSRPAATERVWSAPATLVQEALDIAKYYKRTRGKTITTSVAEGLPPVFAVRDQLVQALLNLVLNAIDATTPGGRIEVRARREAAELVLEVWDDGHGVTPGSAPKLFQPYFTTKPHGTGLGLFVTQKLVHDHGGRVTFDSPPGAGTTFTVRLPLADRVGEPLTPLHN